MQAANDLGANLRFVVMPNNATWAYELMEKTSILPICTTGEAYVEWFETTSPKPLPESTKKGLVAIWNSMKNMTIEERWGKKAHSTPAIEWLSRLQMMKEQFIAYQKQLV